MTQKTVPGSPRSPDVQSGQAISARPDAAEITAEMARLIDAVENAAHNRAAAYATFRMVENQNHRERYYTALNAFRAALAALRLACGVAP